MLVLSELGLQAKRQRSAKARREYYFHSMEVLLNVCWACTAKRVRELNDLWSARGEWSFSSAPKSSFPPPSGHI